MKGSCPKGACSYKQRTRISGALTDLQPGEASKLERRHPFPKLVILHCEHGDVALCPDRQNGGQKLGIRAPLLHFNLDRRTSVPSLKEAIEVETFKDEFAVVKQYGKCSVRIFIETNQPCNR